MCASTARPRPSPVLGASDSPSSRSSDTTNNRMELLAAIRALEALKHPSAVELSTDSHYVHHAFAQRWLDRCKANGWRTSDRKPVQNDELWRRLLELTEVM